MFEVKIDKFKLVEVQEAMCDDYCYFAVISESQEVLDMHCQECPLNNILCEDEE